MEVAEEDIPTEDIVMDESVLFYGQSTFELVDIQIKISI